MESFPLRLRVTSFDVSSKISVAVSHQVGALVSVRLSSEDREPSGVRLVATHLAAVDGARTVGTNHPAALSSPTLPIRFKWVERSCVIRTRPIVPINV